MQLFCRLIYVPLFVPVFFIFSFHVFLFMLPLFGQLFGATMSNPLIFWAYFRPTHLNANAASKIVYCFQSLKAQNAVLNFVKYIYPKFPGWRFKKVLRWKAVVTFQIHVSKWKTLSGISMYGTASWSADFFSMFHTHNVFPLEKWVRVKKG